MNTVSEVLELEPEPAAHIEDELEGIHVGEYARLPRAGEPMMAVDAGIWADFPWGEERE